jgi:hypothetical protein
MFSVVPQDRHRFSLRSFRTVKLLISGELMELVSDIVANKMSGHISTARRCGQNRLALNVLSVHAKIMIITYSEKTFD